MRKTGKDGKGILISISLNCNCSYFSFLGEL